MSQSADNPDPAGDAELTDVGVPGIAGDPRALAGLPAETVVAAALMPAPEPVQRDVGAAIIAPLIAREPLTDILDRIAATLQSLDERVGRLEVQP